MRASRAKPDARSLGKIIVMRMPFFYYNIIHTTNQCKVSSTNMQHGCWHEKMLITSSKSISVV